MSRNRVLLVQDDQDSLEAFSILLGERYTVFAHASPVDALAGIDAAKPDVLVLDIGRLPGEGVQCLGTIRAIARYRDVPALALTGFARDVERRTFLDGGFQAVVVKPVVDHDDLVALIDRLVRSPASVAPRTFPASAPEQCPADPTGSRSPY
jgi:CheY-like chemotaxis protein